MRVNNSKNWFECTPCRRHNNNVTSSWGFPGDVTSLVEIHLSQQQHQQAGDAVNNSGQTTMTTDNGRSLLVESADDTASSNDIIGR